MSGDVEFAEGHRARFCNGAGEPIREVRLAGLRCASEKTKAALCQHAFDKVGQWGELDVVEDITRDCTTPPVSRVSFPSRGGWERNGVSEVLQSGGLKLAQRRWEGGLDAHI